MKKLFIFPLIVLSASALIAQPKSAPSRKTSSEVQIIEEQLSATPEIIVPMHGNTPEQAAKIVPHIGISTENMKKSAELVNKILADEYVLYVKTLNAHWNIVGVHFGALHCFFGQQYEQLAKMIDEIAERARMLGQPSVATMTEFLKMSQLREEPGIYPAEKELITTLLNDHETIIRTLRTAIDTTANELKDMGTSNFFTDLIEKHEKMAWMLRSFLQ